MIIYLDVFNAKSKLSLFCLVSLTFHLLCVFFCLVISLDRFAVELSYYLPFSSALNFMVSNMSLDTFFVYSRNIFFIYFLRRQVKFKCKICGYLYSRKDTLKDHIRGKHNPRYSTSDLNGLVEVVPPNANNVNNNANNNNNTTNGTANPPNPAVNGGTATLAKKD